AAFWGSTFDASRAVSQLFDLGQGRLAVAVGSDSQTQLQNLSYHALDPSLTLAQRGKVYQSMWKRIYDKAMILASCSSGMIDAWRYDVDNIADVPYFAIGAGMDLRYVVKRKSA